MSVTAESRIKTAANALGFDPVGITCVGPAETHAAFREWLSRGFAGEMAYLERGAEKRRDTSLPFPDARSAIVVALDYGGKQPAGPIARYARGDDYHDVMLARLGELHHRLEPIAGRPVAARAYVDTGPILERDLAQRAGLGWIGKNTNLINPDRGSFFFLGVLLTDLALESDARFEADRCGTCTRCLDACPTDAFVEPRVLDATRCISYLTIEHRTSIAPELRKLMGELVYGCDICQDVCPWNHRFAREAGDAALAPRPENVNPGIRDLLRLHDADFKERFRGSPVTRAKRRGLARNAAVVLGNRGDAADIPALEQALNDPEPLVREHAAWALERIGPGRPTPPSLVTHVLARAHEHS
ncbi:MAG: tRNA epoxyqueuosine(34) reductase QueG [Gemmatimonadota bacterium]